MHNYIEAQVILPIGGQEKTGTVKQRACDEEGWLYGKKNANPILDTRTYQIEFPDGEVAEYATNVIAVNMYAQCDPQGNLFVLMDGITDHKKDYTAVGENDRYVFVGGQRRKLCIQWKDGGATSLF